MKFCNTVFVATLAALGGTAAAFCALWMLQSLSPTTTNAIKASFVSTFSNNNNNHAKKNHNKSIRRGPTDARRKPLRQDRAASRIDQEERRLPNQVCPTVGADPVFVAQNGTIDIEYSTSNTLCLLVLMDSTNFLPVARSYDGNEWEMYISVGKIKMNAIHQGCTGSVCTISLAHPWKESLQYKLVASTRTMAEDDEIARFLEQATFGTTKQDIQTIAALPGTKPVDKMAQWIQQQQDSSQTPPNYHRVFFRERANAQFPRSSKYGQVSHPCQAKTIYRQFAFSQKHEGKTLNIVSSGNDKVLSIDGVVLTVVPGPVRVTTHRRGFDDHVMANFSAYTVEELADGNYQICGTPKMGAGAPMRLYHSTYGCTWASFGSVAGNPPVRLPSGYIPSNVVDLDAAGNITEVDKDYFAYRGTPMQLVTAPNGITGDEACDAVEMGDGYVEVVFGTYQGSYYIHDPRWNFHDNTVDNPTPDGGGTVYDETKSNTFDFSARCFNPERNFLNEDSCYLSTEPDACSHKIVSVHTPDVTGPYGRGALVCGSRGEVANDPSLGGEAGRGGFDFVTQKSDETTGFNDFLDQRSMVWTHLAVNGQDQLRQRVAWILYQKLIVNELLSANTQTEDWLNYYDIFVHGAFSTYREVLKEVSYSIMMGEMLTFHYGKSQGFQWSRLQVLEYADENYAREIMQLFSIGTVELNDDGTQKIDENGKPILTYNNDDIMEYARAWTGFIGAQRRGNSMAQNGNRIDPQNIKPAWKDHFPKMGLRNQYVGDGYPLCADLPKKDFLKKGAKYILLGYQSDTEVGIRDPTRWAWESNHMKGRVHLNQTGKLFEILCNATDPANSTSCGFPGVVYLQENIACTGSECNLDHVHQVVVYDKIFYEYVPPACVHLAYYPNPTKIKKRSWSTYKNKFQCADPRTNVAAAACCAWNGTSTTAMQNDTFWGERIKFDTAIDRCVYMNTLDNRTAMCTSTGDLWIRLGYMPYHVFQYYWFSDQVACNLKVKISDVGKIAVVHDIPDEPYQADMERQQVDDDTKVFFRALWSDPNAALNTYENCETTAGCTRHADNNCVCNVQAAEAIAFNFAPTKEQVLEGLFIGAFDPEVYDSAYTSSTINGVTVYQVGGVYSTETIFEVTDDNGVLQRRKNVNATAQMENGLEFRVPVSFFTNALPTKRDAQYETDAVLDQLVYHPNTAPFLANHFAQRFGISNPTPHYISTISVAFKTGFYNYSDGESTSIYGSGKHGDLAATVAAALLDRDARSVLLEDDPAHGGMKETIIKVLSVFRGLNLQTTPEFPYPRFYKSLQDRIGSAVFEAPDIFSYYNPFAQPDGLVSRAGLVSPEMRIHSTPTIMNLMHGLMNLVKYGMDRCFGGIGQSRDWAGVFSECELRKPGHYENASGWLNFTPSTPGNVTAVVDELATILTAGRLATKNRETIVQVMANETNATLAAMKAQQLILSTGEFHATGGVTKTGAARALPVPEGSSDSENYKAVIYILLKGGADTYDVIVPHTCPNEANSVLQQYETARGVLRLTHGERGTVINAIGQPCTHFAVHPNLPILEELYNSGDMSWFMNAGVLNKPNTTRNNYEYNTDSQLFAHNWMQLEAQQLDPYNEKPRTGILGRAVKTLINKYGLSSSSISINKPSYAVNGDVRDDSSPLPIVISQDGGDGVFERPSTEDYLDPVVSIDTLNGANTQSSSLYSDTWSTLLQKAISESGQLAAELEAIDLNPGGGECGDRQFNMAVKMIETRVLRQSSRDFIFIEYGQWDTHRDQKVHVDSMYDSLNEAITCMVSYLKSRNLWDMTTVVVTSEFGRTLSQNSNQGTDHAWGGNYMVASGDMTGGKIHGLYPRYFDPLLSDLVLDRGRMVPTMSFESLWAPVLEWVGLNSSDWDDVLPNWVQAGTQLISMSTVYNDYTDSVGNGTVLYNHHYYLRVRAFTQWLEDGSGNNLDVDDPYLRGLKAFVWKIRSSLGASEAKADQCVKYGDVIHLQSNRHSSYFVAGGVGTNNRGTARLNPASTNNKIERLVEKTSIIPKPQMFNISDGYHNTMTWSQAATFCQSKNFARICTRTEIESFALCALTTCNQNASWVPLYDKGGEYLHVGGNCHSHLNTTANCYAHSELYGFGIPSWAYSGSSNQNRSEVCCAGLSASAQTTYNGGHYPFFDFTVSSGSDPASEPLQGECVNFQEPVYLKQNTIPMDLKDVSRYWVKFGTPFYIRVPGYPYYLNYRTNETIINSTNLNPSSDLFKWQFRWNLGSGYSFWGDPQHGKCIRFGQTVYIQGYGTSYYPNKWLSGSRGFGNNSTLAAGIVEESGGNPSPPWYRWILMSDEINAKQGKCINQNDTVLLKSAYIYDRWLMTNGTAVSTLNIDNAAESDLWMYNFQFERASPADDEIPNEGEQWLAGGGHLQEGDTGSRTEVHVGDVNDDAESPTAEYYEWMFEGNLITGDVEPLV